MVKKILLGILAYGAFTSQAFAQSHAVAEMNPTSGSKVQGKIEFIKHKDFVEVKGKLSNLTPGPHGIHVHEKASCSGEHAEGAGDHFNPEAAAHGGPTETTPKRHVGDLGNVVANDKGEATINTKDLLLTMKGPHSVINRSVVVHAKLDDLKSQPAGDSGERVACGVIKAAAKSKKK